ncbi:MAG: methyltransferase, partial [Saprospiraceae bacterium]|nr:methyltransferase [Saprospiraceae bacterium]
MNKTVDVFYCKEFQVLQEENKMKVNTDAMLLGAWSDVQEKSNILDVGTGTGIIALMLAQRNPVATIKGIEIDEASADEAAENFKSSRWGSHLQCICESIQEYS